MLVLSSWLKAREVQPDCKRSIGKPLFGAAFQRALRENPATLGYSFRPFPFVSAMMNHHQIV
jgi:hypothetical protein